jgi:hypothetical protein
VNRNLRGVLDGEIDRAFILLPTKLRLSGCVTSRNNRFGLQKMLIHAASLPGVFWDHWIHTDAVCFIPTPLSDYLSDYERTSALFPAGQVISSSVLLYTVFDNPVHNEIVASCARYCAILVGHARRWKCMAIILALKANWKNEFRIQFHQQNSDMQWAAWFCDVTSSS